MIRLSIPPFTRGQDLRNDLAFPPLLIRELRNLPSDCLLLSIVIEDTGAVLRADIWTLTVGRCGVVHFVEEFEELSVRYLRWVVGDLESLGIYSHVSQ